jgi:hypothetical protein
VMRAEPGDYVIRGVHGEFYPCKPDIFAETYEEVQLFVNVFKPLPIFFKLSAVLTVLRLIIF